MTTYTQQQKRKNNHRDAVESLRAKLSKSTSCSNLSESFREKMQNEISRQYLVQSGENQFNQIPTIREDVLDDLRLPDNEIDHNVAEQTQFSKKFGKDVRFFSTPKKGEIDKDLIPKYNNTKYTILRSFHYTENQIVPWLYFFVVMDSQTRTSELILYTIHSIKEKGDEFIVVLNATRRTLQREEIRIILDYFNVIEV